MAEARVVRPDRRQLRWDRIDLEGLLPAEHRARIVWSFVESLDLSQLYDQVLSQVLAREGEAGRPAADPAVLLSLWLYATVEGVGSARELERLAQSDAAYRWLAGGVPLNYHGLADFRVGQAEILDRLLTQSVTALIAEGLISLDEIAVDGTKVRASASKESFRTGEKFLKIEAAVAERLAALKQELTGDPGASTRRRQAARKNGQRVRFKARAARARAALERLEAERKSRAANHAKDEARKKAPKASTTDPEARFMRFPDGAVRPAYNAQNRRGAEGRRHCLDRGERPAQRRRPGGADGRRYRPPLRPDARPTAGRHQLRDERGHRCAGRSHRRSGERLYAAAERKGDEIKPASLARRIRKRAKEPLCLKEWRERMASEAGQAVYALRQRIERINADRKNHGFGFLAVRGLIKAKAHALWHALANNLLAAHRLRIETP